MESALERWNVEALGPLGKPRSRSLYAELFGSMKNAHTRCSVVAAHPNDEIVGAGCLLSKLSNVQILHVSNAAPRTAEEAQAAGFPSVEAYAEGRRAECLNALSIAGIAPDGVTELDLPQFEATLQLVPLTLRLVSFIQQSSPEIVLTHAYEGGHPDHDATAFAIHAAIRLIQESGLKPPALFEMAIYPGRNGLSKVPDFLHHPARESTTLVPGDAARLLKLRMFACFDSQKEIFDKSPLGPEKFREAPAYDFTLPPHPGKLYYENFDWGFSGESWRALAREAEAKLLQRCQPSA